MNKNREVMSVTITKCTPRFIPANDLRPLVEAGLLSGFEISHGVGETRVTLIFELPADERLTRIEPQIRFGVPTNET